MAKRATITIKTIVKRGSLQHVYVYNTHIFTQPCDIKLRKIVICPPRDTVLNKHRLHFMKLTTTALALAQIGRGLAQRDCRGNRGIDCFTILAANIPRAPVAFPRRFTRKSLSAISSVVSSAMIARACPARAGVVTRARVYMCVCVFGGSPSIEEPRGRVSMRGPSS